MFLKSSVSLKQEIKCDKIIDFIRILYTVYGKSFYIAFWLKDGITFVETEKLRKLYEYFKNGQLHIGVKPNHHELYRRQGRSDITFTMPVEDLLKIQEYTIKYQELKELGYKV